MFMMCPSMARGMRPDVVPRSGTLHADTPVCPACSQSNVILRLFSEQVVLGKQGRPSEQCEATIDGEHLPGDVAGLLREQEDRSRGPLPCRALSPEWHWGARA